MSTEYEIGLSIHTRLPHMVISVENDIPVGKCDLDGGVCIELDETTQSLGVIPMTGSPNRMVNHHFNPCAHNCADCYKTNT